MSARILIVSGTGTGVGKTIVTAAIAARAAAVGLRLAVVKPSQTGVATAEPGDLGIIEQLTGLTALHEFARYPDPLSPAAAARLAGLPGLQLHEAAAQIRAIAATCDLVLVEGAGGLLVEYNGEHETLADLARELKAPLVLVVRPDLGTLNHTALTLEAMAARGLELAGVVIGSWPNDPDLACRTNLSDLETLASRPLAGAMEQGSGSLARSDFASAATAGLAPLLGGQFDASDFRQRFEHRRNV